MLTNFSVEQSLMKAKSHAKKGELAEAQHLYQTILQNFSNNIRAQQGLASLNKHKQNNIIQKPPQEAVDQLVSLYNQGQIILVVKQAEVLLKQYPDTAVVWNILGASRSKMGKLEEAIEAYKKCIYFAPGSAEIYNNMGVALRNLGKFDEAIEVYKKSISLKPDYAEAYINMGVTFKDLGKFEEAIEAYKKCISLKPDYAEAYDNMGVIFKSLGKLDQAITMYNKAILLKPNHANTHYNMGNALCDKLYLEKAIEFYSKSISLNPNYIEAYNNMGNALKDLGRLEEAIEAYKKSLLLMPDDAGIYNNLGTTFHKIGRLEEAEENLRKAILRRPNFAEYHQNLCFTLLNNGKLKEGLDESEWRWKTDKFLSLQRCFLKPLWDGKQSLNGKRILLWCEQGIGDTLNFSSCLSFLTSKAEHCILECQEKLVPLLKRSFPNVEVKPENRSKDPERDDFDFHLPMGSLYKHFLDEITKNPKPEAYLVPDQVRVNYWKDRLNSLGKGPFIGICWKSSVVSSYRLQHYPTISQWSQILSIPDVTFINLQYNDFTDDLAKIKDELGVTVHNFDDLDQYNNIDDVVALCAALDIAVTTKVTPMIYSSAVGTPTKIANLRQSIWNNILFNPVSSSVDMYERNTWETWDNVFNLIAKDICLFKNKMNEIKNKL